MAASAAPTGDGRSDDFVEAVQINAGHLDVECGNDFHIEIQRD